MQGTLVPTLLRDALVAPDVVRALQHFLDWSPEIKHEGLVCTHLSAHLRSKGIDSRREVSWSRRRVDLIIEGIPVEAKYHFEGDLLEIERVLLHGRAFNPAGWNSAPNALLAELTRGKNSYFLWNICIRSTANTSLYRYANRVDDFYASEEVSSLESAADAAETFIDEKLQPLFAKIAPNIESTSLPRIAARHSVLLSRLYFFYESNEPRHVAAAGGFTAQ